MLSQLAIQKILGIADKVYIRPLEMADKVNVTFYPKINSASKEVLKFGDEIRASFERLGVNIVPFEESMEVQSFKKRIRRFFKYSLSNVVYALRRALGLPSVNFWISWKTIRQLCAKYKFKKGISIVCLGRQDTDDLAMQSISSFKHNSVITILDFPDHISEESDFETHFETAMGLFAHHMSNIIFAVNKKNWMMYNFNLSHPIYKRTGSEKEFDDHILHALIPKLAAPISPHVFKEFKLSSDFFDPFDELHKDAVTDLKQGALLFDKTNLYPKGKQIEELPFRENFHRYIGKLHLDGRSGMSFGFFAYQMPIKLPRLISKAEFCVGARSNAFNEDDYFVDTEGNIFILCNLPSVGSVVTQVPDVWVLSLRSGANKTHFDVKHDLIKIGLSKGEMWMQFPEGVTVKPDYKPSFDTKVILAHAVANSIIATLIRGIEPDHFFVRNLESKGVAISHWHGYFQNSKVPKGVHVYGEVNPHVSCSSPQSAIYALSGKLELFFSQLESGDLEDYTGDIHIEPHHGTNICYPSLVGLANYLLDNPDATALGNKYLHA